MKGYAAGLLAALMLLLFVSGAAGQETLRLYVQEDVLEKAQVQRLMTLLEDDGQTQWMLMENGQTLRELVLAGNLPDLAICAPAAARHWAKEGMLLALQMHIGSQQRIQRQVITQCVCGEELFMAPLIARHRQMAVNGRMMDEMGLGYMMDSQTYPVWYPAQFYQILEEFLLHDMVALDVWQADMENSAPLEAMTQAISGGMLLGEDGERCEADSTAMCAGVQWLADAVENEMIGYCETRQEALERFLKGETAIFVDWTGEADGKTEGIEISLRPYPSAVGMPVRSFELAGVCAFASGDDARDVRLMKACTRLYEGAQEALGPQGIWQDGAVWLPALEATDGGATLRSLFCAALQDVLGGKLKAEAALQRVQTAMEALKQTE